MYGGWNRGYTLDKAECYNTKTGSWYPADHLKDETEGRSYFGIEHIKGQVYVIGKHHFENVSSIISNYLLANIDLLKVKNLTDSVEL